MAARNTEPAATEPAEVESPKKKSFVVTGALAIVKEADGKVKYLYRGASVPASLPAAEVDRLVELGLIGSE